MMKYDDKNLVELKLLGMTILKGLIPQKKIQSIKKEVKKIKLRLEKQDKNLLYKISPFLASPSHIGFLCPLQSPFCDEQVCLSPLLYQLLENYLGVDFYLHEYVSNVAIANGKSNQRPHPDQEYSPTGPVGVVCNIALEKTNYKNGMTKMWVETHKKSLPLKEEILDKYTCIQPDLEPGDVLVRDISLIHQGVSNLATRDRFLLALVFKPKDQIICDYAVDKISKKLWSIGNKKLNHLLRFHEFSNEENLPGRCYPAPKDNFSGEYVY